MPKQQSKGATGSESPKQKSSELSKFQAFTTETVHRSVLKNAPYNPRHLTAKAKVKIRESLQRVGLVQPLVWNKRSGNLVGGHQRLGQLDALEGRADYSLTVAVVDVDEKRERELNILLNNTEVAGEWDLEKLKTMLEGEIELLNTGFDEGEFMKLFGEAPSQPKQAHQDELAEQLKGVKEAYQKLAQASASKDDTDFYNVVVFASYNERKEFLKELGLEDNRYVDGRTLTQIIRDFKESQLALTGQKGTGTGVGEDKAKLAEKPA